MAGNIVKWWRQFKQYKQFSVLQECATDSEDLIYPARAASTCSAPPDLLLTSNESKNLTTSISSTQSSSAAETGQQPQRVVNKETQQSISETEAQLNHHTQKSQTQESQDGRVRLEEFTCDVSVDDGKKPQPIQFSFTLYDLDGHGKITKDDIAGIVSTIYDSIGKTVVVPHYGKKTINVRLTVSPDSKKHSAPTTSTTTTKLTTSATKKLPLASSRRRSYRPRKLLSDESENDDDLDDSESSATSDNLVVVSGKQQQQQQQNNNEVNNKLNTSQTPLIVIDNNSNLCNKNSEIFKTNNKNTVYESINNLKCSNQLENLVLLKSTNNNNSSLNENVVELCKNCTPDEKLMKKVHHQHQQSPAQTNGVNYTIKHHKQIPSSKKKVLRKSRSRKQKPSEIPTARVRSLSVGNENKWKFAHHANNLLNEQQRQHNDALLKQQKQFLSAKEYQWNNIDMRKQELIEIIRDSMEKNRLCFQSNRKSREMPSNSSRLRSNTISKMTHVSEADQTHLCAFDSFLHATICSNLHNNNNNNNNSSNSNNNTPNKQHQHLSGKQSNNKSKIPSKQNVKMQSNIPCQQLKLKTSILNQINPNLTAEQKLSRKLNDVEKWLFERESQNNISCYPSENVGDSCGRLQKDQDKNILNSSLTNKLKASVETSTPKKVFNKEILITKKGKSMQQQPKNVNKNQLILEYSNVPVNVDASECENLISISDDEIPTGNAPTVVEKPEKETVENDGSSTSKSSQSTVHRYVHEHIHLHYHYLKNEHDE